MCGHDIAWLFLSPQPLSLHVNKEQQDLLPRLRVLCNACLVHVCLQPTVWDLVRHCARGHHANTVPTVLHCALTAPSKLPHGVPHTLHRLADSISLLSRIAVNHIRVGGCNNVEEVLEVHAGEVSCPSGHAQPRVRIMQHVALCRLAGCLLLVVGRTGFDLGSDLLVISRRQSGLVGLGVARSDVHEVRVLAGRKHLLPGDYLI